MATKKLQKVKLPMLYKKTSKGETQEWHVQALESKDGTAAVRIEYGLQGGKKQVQIVPVLEGKNIGKKNETTPYEQAIKDAQSRWKHQRDRSHYAEDVETSGDKRALSPMLAHPYEKHKDKVDWSSAFEQPKLDGYRCIARKEGKSVSLTSRRGSVFNLPHISDVLSDLLRAGEALDGELYCHGLSLNKIDSLIDKPCDDTLKITYNVYDTPMDAPFEERYDWLCKKVLFEVPKCVQLVSTVRIGGEADLFAMQAHRIANGYEGSMLRHGKAPYEPKRSTSLLKVKTFQDDEFLIVGYKPGHNATVTFKMVTKAGHEFEAYAPGSIEEKQQAWIDRNEYIGQWMKVKYAYYTNTEKPVPWHPVALGMRRKGD